VTADKRAERTHPNSLCPECEGKGSVWATEKISTAVSFRELEVLCPSCGGTGERKAR
jgi:DnaJ-class molecular chaperone